jgi:hypothetical protein
VSFRVGLSKSVSCIHTPCVTKSQIVSPSFQINAYNCRACRKTLAAGCSSGSVGNFSVVEISTRGLRHNIPYSYYHPPVHDRLSVSQPGHLPEVIADTDQLPYQPHLLQAPVPESPESKYLLDLSEHVLNQAGPVSHPLFPVYP